jgi:hypothetical protein
VNCCSIEANSRRFGPFREAPIRKSLRTVSEILPIMQKGKAILVRGRGSPCGCETSMLSRFLEIRLTDGAEFVSLKHRPLFSQGKFLVLISICAWVNPRIIVRLKIPVTSRIEPEAFQLVSQCPTLFISLQNTFQKHIVMTWVMTLWHMAWVYQPSGGTYYLHVRPRRCRLYITHFTKTNLRHNDKP